MEVAVKSLFLHLNPKFKCHGLSQIITPKPTFDGFISCVSRKRFSFSHQSEFKAPKLPTSSLNLLSDERKRHLPAVFVVLSDTEEMSVSSFEFEDFSIPSAIIMDGGRTLKISAEVSGVKTRAVFDKIFEGMVAAAQPIPGFRRVKGGKTPNIPKDILLEILGPSRVYEKVIKKVINLTVAAYAEKRGLKVRKELRIEQSFEDLEACFEPDENFCFDAIIELQDAV